MTKTLGINTAIGFIRHKRITVGALAFDAPVALEKNPNGVGIRSKDNGQAYVPYPRTLNGKVLHVLPGGMLTTGGDPHAG